MNSKVLKRLFSFLSVIIFVITAISGWAASLKVHIIDVGQGDCELIISPTGTSVLIDAGDRGKGYNVVYPYLNGLGIKDLDYIVASHYDSDHIGGMDEVLEKLGGDSHILKAAYDRGSSHHDNTTAFQEYVIAVGQKRTTISPGDVINLGGGAILTCIATGGQTINDSVNLSSDDENNLGVVLRLDFCDFQMSLGGDCEDTMESVMASLVGDVDVYKVNHHGSDDASCQKFLEVLKPKVSTISVGSNNRYYHPDSSVHTRLENIGSYIYQTESGEKAISPPIDAGEVANGSFIIETDGNMYTISGSDLKTTPYQTDGSHSCSKVVFSKVLYDSWVYYESEGEWIELYNTGLSAVDIGKWTIKDNSGTGTYTIPSGTTIGGQSYLVIADGSTEFIKRYGSGPDLSNLSLQLNNDGDYLILKNTGGTVIDQVAWESGGSSISGWGSTSLPYADDGKCIVRSDVNQDTDTYSDWMSNLNSDPNLTRNPLISLSRTYINFELCPGNISEDNTFSISNSGEGTLNWSVSDNVNWLSCTPASGSGSGTVTISVDTMGLASGTYTGTITVTDPNAINSPQKITVSLKVKNVGCNSQIVLSRKQLNYAASGVTVTGSQAFLVSNSGSGALNWAASASTDWITCSPSSGSNSGVVTVSINSNRFSLPKGNYKGYVTVSDPNATNNPQVVTIILNIISSDALPFGTFETPIHNSTVCSSIPVTGWVLDDIEVESVKIYRKTGNSLAFIGDAMLVEGARPDVEEFYDDYPRCYQAGWGYMMLTNFLPNQGNGEYIISAIARDTTGHDVTLGTKTIKCDNANAVKPFGAIDTPTQGGFASGKNYINWGWVLTPQSNCIEKDGSTINVYVDGVKLGHPTYNIYRSDIATMFPDNCNSNGAAGYFYLDTTAYANGVHTIQWVVTDNDGNTDGIGSRYFTVQNLGGASSQIQSIKSEFNLNPLINGAESDILPGYFQDNANYGLIRVRKGYNDHFSKEIGAFELIYPDDEGVITIEIKELERLEIHFNDKSDYESMPENTAHVSVNVDYRGYLKVNDQFRSLPAGSTFDRQRGVFYWQPGVGFLGEYCLVFMETKTNRRVYKLIIRIVPRF